MKKLLLALVVLVLSMSVIVGCTKSTPSTATATALSKVKIEMPINGSPADPLRTADLAEIVNYINVATDGRADVTIHYADTLAAPKDYYSAVNSGMAGLTDFQPSLTPGVFPLQGVFSLPGVFQTQDQSVFVAYELFQKYPQFAAEFGTNVVLSNHSLMTSNIHSRQPIRSLADLKGKAIVAQDDTSVKILKLLGANASIMSGGDMYMAAERGVIDGALVPWGFVDGEKMYEQLKCHTEIHLSPVAFCFIMNKDTFNKFTPTEQANLKCQWFNLVRPTIHRNLLTVDKAYTTYLTAVDQQMFTLSADDQAMVKKLTAPVNDDWAAQMTAKGYPGQDIVKDALRWSDLYLKN